VRDAMKPLSAIALVVLVAVVAWKVVDLRQALRAGAELRRASGRGRW
jgi:hypothetical protein